MDDESIYAHRVHIRKDKTNPRRLAVVTLVLFAIEPAWPVLLAGIVLVMAAILLHGWAAGYLARAGYAERETVLTVRGPYRHNRNPYYLAQLVMDLGLFMVAGRPLLYLVYFPIIFTVYRRWVANEEKFLEAEFGADYHVLKQEVPRWGFRVSPAPARGADVKFQWATYKMNRELPRSLSHLCLLLLFLLFDIFGNPFAGLDFALRLTILAVVGSWLVVRDIFPTPDTEKSIGWAVAALSMALLTGFLLTWSHFWYPWTGAAAWILIALGLYLCFLVTLSAFLASSPASKQPKRKLLTRPICRWYILALGIGLLSCSLAGVWLGVSFALVLWALHVGRWIAIHTSPQGIPVGISLFILVAASGGAAVLRQLQ